MHSSQTTFVVIGGGAAGFFCAVNAAANNPDLKVMILEKSSKLLSKVRVSGGGRCNVTHSCFDIQELIKRYPRGQNFLKKSFHQFFTKDTIQWFEQWGVKLKAESDGRMFPVTDSSATIIECLLNEANKHKVEILLNAEVKSIHQENNQHNISLTNGKVFTADYVCIASGGFSKPEQFNWIKALGHHIENPVPSLFTFNMPGNSITALMGVSVENATVKIIGTKLSETAPLLITHWGMSGPAILKLSAWGARLLAEKNYQFSITVNWLNDEDENRLRSRWPQLRNQFAGLRINNKNPFHLPQRLWSYLLQQSQIDENKRWSELSSKEQNLLIKNLTAQQFDVNGKTTFKEEFVTAGGIQLSEIDANTMQSKLVNNLFFAGEIMDVDGITGGFNFQHAWTSGWIAAQAISKKMRNNHINTPQ